jgi:hypothetical protein
MTDPRHPIPRPFGRREFLALGTGAFALGSLPIALRRHVAVAHRTLPVMGTIAEITVADRSETLAQRPRRTKPKRANKPAQTTTLRRVRITGSPVRRSP